MVLYNCKKKWGNNCGEKCLQKLDKKILTKKIEKKIDEIFFGKNWKIICMQWMLPFQRSREENLFFCFGCATHNKALDVMKLIPIFFFFHQKMYGANFERIDNGPYSTTISTMGCQRNFPKNLKICVSHFFVVIHNIFKWKINK